MRSLVSVCCGVLVLGMVAGSRLSLCKRMLDCREVTVPSRGCVTLPGLFEGSVRTEDIFDENCYRIFPTSGCIGRPSYTIRKFHFSGKKLTVRSIKEVDCIIDEDIIEEKLQVTFARAVAVDVPREGCSNLPPSISGNVSAVTNIYKCFKIYDREDCRGNPVFSTSKQSCQADLSKVKGPKSVRNVYCGMEQLSLVGQSTAPWFWRLSNVTLSDGGCGNLPPSVAGDVYSMLPTEGCYQLYDRPDCSGPPTFTSTRNCTHCGSLPSQGAGSTRSFKNVPCSAYEGFQTSENENSIDTGNFIDSLRRPFYLSRPSQW